MPETEDLSMIKGGEDETPYYIMFGPDICGGNKKVHSIISYNGSNVERKTKKIEIF